MAFLLKLIKLPGLNKKKIINDPLYGFIVVPNDLIFDLINHPYFQRLRRIRQLGLTDFVYPGALHTRFHHALGAMHLMVETMDNLRQKGVEVSPNEYTASLAAMLLHDIGHGPFSHALENNLIPGLSHEEISSVLIDSLNDQFDGALNLATKIFSQKYSRPFFNQLVASQLDIDRLDYLNRDSYFTGVVEGRIGAERIIKLLAVKNDEIAIEEKGVYSVENFLSARRLMYWQVYLHKTVVGVEALLRQIFLRAREIRSDSISRNEALAYFLNNQVGLSDLRSRPEILDLFCSLDDHDIIVALKEWVRYPDPVLSCLSSMLLERRLMRVKLTERAVSESVVCELKKAVESLGILPPEFTDHLVLSGTKSNKAYIGGGQKIAVLKRDGSVMDIAQAADLPNIRAMSKIVVKHYLCWPKTLHL
jgi:HD superfamily phosphohydrolase